jgi:hypothetical protein
MLSTIFGETKMHIESVNVNLSITDISSIAEAFENSLFDVMKRNIEYYDTFEKFKLYNDQNIRLCKEFYMMGGRDWSAARIYTTLEDRWRFLRTELKPKNKKSKVSKRRK